MNEWSKSNAPVLSRVIRQIYVSHERKPHEATCCCEFWCFSRNHFGSVPSGEIVAAVDVRWRECLNRCGTLGRSQHMNISPTAIQSSVLIVPIAMATRSAGCACVCAQFGRQKKKKRQECLRWLAFIFFFLSVRAPEEARRASNRKIGCEVLRRRCGGGLWPVRGWKEE